MGGKTDKKNKGDMMSYGDPDIQKEQEEMNEGRKQARREDRQKE